MVEAGPVGVSVVWTARVGCSAEVEALLLELRAATLAEAGCVAYHVHRLERPGVFLLYEQYDSFGAIEAHHATEHYLRLVKEAAPALIVGREIIRGRLISARDDQC